MERRRFLQLLGTSASPAVLAQGAEAGYEVSDWPAQQKAPPLDLPDLDGRRWRLGELRGRAVLLNFWASWCEPCRAEMPTLQQLAEVYGPDKLAVLAVNFKETAARAGQFVRSTGLQLPVLLDARGETARDWGVRVFPSTLLVDADGQPRQRVRGEVDWTGRGAERLVSALLVRRAGPRG